jgi:2,5-dihydroxypyridine 5,6-dioxygenase
MGNYYSNQLLAGVNNCLFNCGKIKAGDNVLILSLIDDRYNPVDDEVVKAMAMTAQLAGAKVQILWTSGMEKFWWDEVPPIVLGAFGAADLVINNTIAIGRPLKAVRSLMFGKGIAMIRNMATTIDVMSSEWARFPFQLSDEITRRVGEVVERGHTWRVVHPNGTDIGGKFGRPSPTQSGFSAYNILRAESKNRPFPQGNHVPVTVVESDGIIVTERTLPWEARHMGISEIKFSRPMKVTVENNKMTNFEGGSEAEAVKKFFGGVAAHIGEDAWNLSSLHSGIHPKANMYESPETNPDMWHRAEHNNPSVMHFHLGGSKVKPDFDYPFMWHISVELENATIYVDGEKLSDAGHLTVLEDPELRTIAAQYGDPDELLRQVRLNG